MRASSLGRFVVIACLAGGAVAAVLAARAEQRALAADLGRARDLHGTAHTGSRACRSCHPDHGYSWARTFHRTMTADVTPDHPERVAGDFSGASYRYAGVAARMYRDGRGRFKMSFVPDGGRGSGAGSEGDGTRAGAGGRVDVEVVRAVGSRRYQQYLGEVGGTLWRLPMAFHIEDRRWFHMNGAFLTPDPDPDPDADADAAAGDRERDGDSDPARARFGGGAFDRHVTRWNDNCVFCHNVAPNPGREPGTGAFRTTVAELGIACEACHGPGGEHARRNADPLRRYALHVGGAADPTIVNPARLSPGRSADLCGRCHGQRMADDVEPFLARGDPFVPGDALALYSAPLWRDTALAGDRTAFAARFWDDGTPRLTAYEYQGLLQSACAQRGEMTCTSCHGMHEGDPRGQIRPAAAGDRACTGCHAALGAPSAVAAHTRHRPEGAGAACVGCHMPRIVYGVLDAHPSHRIEIPDPARDIAAGRPDACTLCHVEADRAWAARERARLWPPRAGITPGAGGAAVAAVAGDGLEPLRALFAGDPVARALAADALGRAGATAGRMAALLEAMSGDRYPAVRRLAARALVGLLAAPHPEAAEAARSFDATAPRSERQRRIASIEALLPQLVRAAPAPTEIAALRARARLVDIDIGE